jgi:hypothetical protein
VARERGASKEAQRVLAEITAVDSAGRKALAARADAVASVARVALRMHTWKEGANKARRSVEAVLTSYAVEHSLPRDYADAFFPARKRTGKPAGKGGGGSAPGGDGGAPGGAQK